MQQSAHAGFNRPSLSIYSQFFRSQLLNPIAMLTAGFTLLVQLPVAAESTRIAQSNADAYPPQEVQTFLSACISNATANGLDRNFAQSYCTCTINAFQERYTYAEFTELALSTQSTQQPSPELIEVAQICITE